MLGSLLVFGLFYFAARAVGRSNMSSGSKGPLVVAVWLLYFTLLFIGIQEIDRNRRVEDAIATEQFNEKMRNLGFKNY